MRVIFFNLPLPNASKTLCGFFLCAILLVKAWQRVQDTILVLMQNIFCLFFNHAFLFSKLHNASTFSKLICTRKIFSFNNFRTMKLSACVKLLQFRIKTVLIVYLILSFTITSCRSSSNNLQQTFSYILRQVLKQYSNLVQV